MLGRDSHLVRLSCYISGIQCSTIPLDLIVRLSQSSDEKAGLYRVRGDCYMVGNTLEIAASALQLPILIFGTDSPVPFLIRKALVKPIEAEQDYSKAIEFLQGPGGEQADPTELPTSL